MSYAPSRFRPLVSSPLWSLLATVVQLKRRDPTHINLELKSRAQLTREAAAAGPFAVDPEALIAWAKQFTWECPACGKYYQPVRRRKPPKADHIAARGGDGWGTYTFRVTCADSSCYHGGIARDASRQVVEYLEHLQHS